MQSLTSLPSVRRRGAITPLTVLSLSLLLGMVALTIDGGMLMEDRRHAQATADAAALAAADDLFTHYASNQGIDSGGTAKASALTIAAANGFNNDGVQSIVTVNVSPQNYQGGPNAGTPLPAGYVEVIVQYNASRLFSGVFGSGTIPVPARAVARGQWIANNNALIALNLHAAGAVALKGNARLAVSGGMQVNSDSLLALELGGRGGLTASSITLNPVLEGAGRILSFLLGLSSLNYSSAAPDPLRYLPPPDPSQLSPRTVSSLNLYPGVYNNGINVSGNGKYLLHANSDGTPGIYYVQGGLSVSGQATIQMAADATAGVMIYNAGGPIAITGRGSLTVNPPSSGPYQGIGLFQQRGTLLNPAPPISIKGNGNLTVMGTIYAAYANVTIVGNGRVTGSQVIVDTVAAKGNASLTVNLGAQSVVHTRLLGLVQ